MKDEKGPGGGGGGGGWRGGWLMLRILWIMFLLYCQEQGESNYLELRESI
jgi:hypothetical protein